MRVENTDEYATWIDMLTDQAGRARILMRVERLIGGIPGQHRNLTDGVSELKVVFGPGDRVNCSLRRTKHLLLLGGGDELSQLKDIQLVIKLAKNFKE